MTLTAYGTKVDVRDSRPRDRHPLIFSTFRSLAAGEAMELVNDHDPKPLYYQFQAELPGQFAWDYLEQGPDVWRVRHHQARRTAQRRPCCGACGGAERLLFDNPFQDMIMKSTHRLWRWLGLIFVLSFGALGYLGLADLPDGAAHPEVGRHAPTARCSSPASRSSAASRSGCPPAASSSAPSGATAATSRPTGRPTGCTARRWRCRPCARAGS